MLLQPNPVFILKSNWTSADWMTLIQATQTSFCLVTPSSPTPFFQNEWMHKIYSKYLPNWSLSQQSFMPNTSPFQFGKCYPSRLVSVSKSCAYFGFFQYFRCISDLPAVATELYSLLNYFETMVCLLYNSDFNICRFIFFINKLEYSSVLVSANDSHFIVWLWVHC